MFPQCNYRKKNNLAVLFFTQSKIISLIILFKYIIKAHRNHPVL